MAIVLTTVFLLVIIPRQASLPKTDREPYLVNLESDDDFRAFVTENTACFNSTSGIIDPLVRRYLPLQYDYIFCSGTKVAELPERTIYVDTLFMAGNLTDVSYKTVSLYYWVNP